MATGQHAAVVFLLYKMHRKQGRYLFSIVCLAALAANVFGAPLPITSLVAVPSQVIQGDVQLTWTVPDPADTSSEPSGYLIKVSTEELNSQQSPINIYAEFVSTYTYNWTVFAASGTVESITLTGLTPATQLYFAVMALDLSYVAGEWLSNLDSGYIPDYNTQTYAVVYDTIPAQAAGFEFSSYGNNRIDLQWQANSEYDLAGYKVECSTWSQSAGFGLIADILKPGTTHEHLNLVNGNTYYYRVRAYDNQGKLGFYCAVESTRPWINLGTPVLDPVYSLSQSTSSINWAWNILPDSTSGYRIINSTSGVIYKEALTANDTYWIQEALTPNASNTMLIQVFNGFVTMNSGSLTHHTWATEPILFSTSAIGAKTADLAWSHGLNAPDTRYTIRRTTDSFKIDVVMLNTNATSFYDIGLLEGVTYQYSIRGISYENDTQSVNFATTTAVTARVKPGEAAFGSNCVTGSLDGQVHLEWLPPYDDIGDDESGRCSAYLIKWSSTSIYNDSEFNSIAVSSSALIPDDGASVPMAADITGLYPGTTYFFAIKAIDRAGNYSSMSATKTIVAQDRVPDPPAAVLALALSSASVHVSWVSPAVAANAYDDISEYALYRATYSFVQFQAGVSSAAISHPATYYVDLGLEAETTYYYRLRTLDKGDLENGYFSIVYISTYSSPIVFARSPDTTPPDPITELAAVTGCTEGHIHLTWTSPGDDGPAGQINNGRFRIDCSTDPLKNFTTSYFITEITTTTAPGDQNFVMITGLEAASTHYFRIWAADEAMNWSALSWGTTATAQVDVSSPSAVNIISVNTFWRRAALSWNSPGDDGDYNVLNGTAEIRATSAGPILTETDWTNAGFVYKSTVAVNSVAAGSGQGFTVLGLTNGVTYYFAVRVADERGNISPLAGVSPSASSSNLLPDPFLLDGPADGQIINSSTLLTWFASADAVDSVYGDTLSYAIYVSSYSDFNPAVRSVQDALTFLLDVAGLEDKTVYWKIEAVDRDAKELARPGTFSTTRTVRVNVVNTQPDAFDLIAPSTGNIIVGISAPLLTWGASANVDPGDTLSYRVDYSSFEDFSVLTSSDNLAITSYTTPALAENATYWWRVWAFDGYVPVMSDSTGYFRINATAEAPAAFSLNAPAEGVVLSSTTVSFSWNATTDPDPDETVSYDLSWSELENFSSSTTVSGLTGTTTSFQGFEENYRYFWRVTAVGSCGLRRQSAETNRFYVDTVKTLPAAFVLQEPAYDAIITTTTKPLFRWTEAVDPDPADNVRYIFEISPRADFPGDGTTIAVDRGADQYYIPLSDLADQTSYYWRVKASGYQDYPPKQVDPDFTVSSVFVFAISMTNSLPQDFALLSPANGAIVTTKAPLLKWAKAVDPDLNSSVSYAVTVSTMPDFSAVLSAVAGLAAIEYQLPETLSENKTYYWKVDATDNKNASKQCSEVFSFSVPTLNTPQVPVGLKGSLSADKLKFTLSWSPVTTNSDGSTLDDLAGYNVYRGSDQRLVLFTALGAGVNSWTDETMQGVEYYYRVTAVDASGIESVLEDAPLLNSRSLDTLKLMSGDRSVIIDIPAEITNYLLAANNPFGKDLRVKFEANSIPDEEKDKILSSYSVKVLSSDGASMERFSFSHPLTMRYGYGSGTFVGRKLAAIKVPAAELGSLNIYWNNDIEYIRVGCTTVAGDQQVVWKAGRSGEYQLRRVSRAPTFSVASVYPPKIFTPGIAPYEKIIFNVENPQGDKVVGKVYDLRGDFVADLKSQGDPTYTSVILEWDGKNNDGGDVSKGVYIYQIEGSGRTLNGTVMVAR